MNWLAHLYLSEPDSGFRLGNLLPDLMNVSNLEQVPEDFRRGVACHRVIDAFTDMHPLVRRSIQRLDKPYRRVAPILVDVFYDHFLSVWWEHYAPLSLKQFVGEVYQSFDEQRLRLPEEVWAALDRMREENWLGSYGDLAGVRITLERMSRRFRRPVDLVGGVMELEKHYDGLGADFDHFFPELQACVAANYFKPGSLSSMPASL